MITMEQNSNSYILYLLTMVTVTYSLTLNDFELPGIFSSKICSDDNLIQKLDPLCQCKNLTEITDLHSLCRSHVKFGNCIEEKLKENNQDGQFMKHVFSNKRFNQFMVHLCHRQHDAAEIAKCTKPEIPRQCNTKFETSLSKLDSFDESLSCKITEKALGECYWRVYENDCSPTVRYFWSKLSVSFMSARCSKYGKSKTDLCDVIRKAFHPNPRTQTLEQCHRSVLLKRVCFQLERLSSLHHDDVWLNMEFELDKFMRFERFRCDIQKEKDRNHDCEHPHRPKLEHCINDTYGKAFERQTKLLRDGGTVTVDDICRVYDNATQCILGVLKHCEVNAVHLNALFCGSMPTSCHCPVNLEAEILARSSISSKQIPTTWIVCLCLYATILNAFL